MEEVEARAEAPCHELLSSRGEEWGNAIKEA